MVASLPLVSAGLHNREGGVVASGKDYDQWVVFYWRYKRRAVGSALQTYRVPTSLRKFTFMDININLFRPDFSNRFKDKRLEKRGFN